MQKFVMMLIILYCLITADAFTFPRLSRPKQSNARLNVATTEPPVVIPVPVIDTISPITIDQIFEPVANITAFPDQPLIEIAKIGGDVKSGVLKAKTMSIYRDTSYVNDPNINTNLGVKTPLLFLPGLDGVGNYSANSVSKLNLVYDVWKLAIKAEDRSSFIELANTVLEAIDSFDTPVTLVGESFGGLLAAYCALRDKKGKIAKLILINPATSFDRTNWNLLAPIIASTGRINPIAFPLVAVSVLVSTAVDIAQVRRVGGKIISSIDSTDAAIEVFESLYEAGRFLLDLIPPETLSWRISKWFSTGVSIMEGRYSEIVAPTLVLVGKNDRLLPSRSEGKRLKKEMTSSRVVVKELDIGHALLEDDFIDFADVILKSEPPVYVKDTLEASMPTKEDMEGVEKQVIFMYIYFELPLYIYIYIHVYIYVCI
jgi:pimeloyl-ACP methyl ester carboxylesterase